MELGYYPAPGAAHGVVEPIPNTQEEINAQADAAIRDLFPRIPNTDRQQIIDHAFQKVWLESLFFFLFSSMRPNVVLTLMSQGKLFNGAPVVGLVANLPLSRRVQLAVLAHIRHNHTRYDDLLRQTNWANARKTVERVCLDILVKWRGDEENGRDDLETILREIVVISDSEDDDEDGDESDGEESEDSSLSVEEADAPTTGAGAEASKASRQPPLVDAVVPVSVPTGPKAGPKRKVVAGEKPKGMSKKALKRQRRAERKAAKLAKRSQRGFQRYKAAWKQAVDRNRENGAVPPSSAAPMARSISHGSYVAAEPGQAPGQPAYVGAAHELVQVVPQPRPKNNLAKPAWARGHGGVPEDFLPLEPRNGAFGVNQASLTERKVASLAHERPRPSSLGPASPVRNRYQDLLVPSIEPLSPGSASHQPQFIRTLPPRKHAREESIEYRPMMQHNISPASPPTPVYHDVVSKRHRVAMNDNVRTKGWTDYRVPSGQQNYSGPSTVAKSYQGLSATESINHRIGPPGVELIHRQSPRMIVEACERDRTFTEIRGPPRSRGNPIIVDSYEPRSEPVIVTRIPDVNRGPSRRIQDDYDIVEIRRPVPNDNYYGEAWGAASAQGISPRVPAHETFAVDRPRESRPTVYYYSDGEGQPRPQPTPEPIYIRTVEPRGSVREYMGPAVERAPATSLNRDAYRPGLISAPLRTRPVEPYVFVESCSSPNCFSPLLQIP